MTESDTAPAAAPPAPKGRGRKTPGPKEAAAKAAREAKSGGTPPPAKAAKAPAKKAAPPAKKAAAKAPAAPKEGGIVRAPSTVSKEGTQVCEFSGETLPVTAFPTVKQKEGGYTRGTVARKHLEAYRAQRKTEREAERAKKAEDKAAKAKEKPAAPVTPDPAPAVPADEPAVVETAAPVADAPSDGPGTDSVQSLLP